MLANGGLGDLGRAGDLKAWQLAAAQSQDAGDAQRVDGFWGTFGTRTAITQTGVPLGAEAREPFEDRANRDAQSSGDCGGGLMKIENAMDEFRSTARGELGSTVQVHAALDFGSVLISQPHLSKSSPHEQPIGTSQLGEKTPPHRASHQPRCAQKPAPRHLPAFLRAKPEVLPANSQKFRATSQAPANFSSTSRAILQTRHIPSQKILLFLKHF